MLKAAIERILSLSEPHILTVNNEQYTDRELTRVPRTLRAEPLEVHTLSALVNYIEAGCDDNAEQTDIDRRFVVHIQDYNQVYLTREVDEDRRREVLLKAVDHTETFSFGRWMDIESFIIALQAFFTPDYIVGELIKIVSNVTDIKAVDHTETFSFGRWMDIESFIIALQAFFTPDYIVGELIKIVSNVTDNNSVQRSDNGLTQSVIAKTGIVTSAKVNLPNPVELHPLCTFSDIPQPARSFIFRLRSGESGVSAALFEADGNTWKKQSIEAIAFYFESTIPEELKDDVIILA